MKKIKIIEDTSNVALQNAVNIELLQLQQANMKIDDIQYIYGETGYSRMCVVMIVYSMPSLRL